MRALSLLLVLGAFSPGAIIFKGTPALGSDLAGGSITVIFDNNNGGISVSAPITNPSGSLGEATSAGNFTFSVCCETSGNAWTLKNLNSGMNILSFVIALAGSQSAFDNGQAPFADFSGTHPTLPSGLIDAPGVDTNFTSVVFSDQITNVLPVGAQNMYLTLTLTPELPLALGDTALFAADTDTEAVPEPSTVIPVLVGLAAIAQRRRSRA